jgi:CRISPR-associated endonuclease Cas1
MHADDTNYTVIKNGVVVVSGTGPAIRADDNRLVIRDGPQETRPLVLTRAEAARKLQHVIVCGNSGGFITFDALRWLRDTGVAFSQLDSDGTVIVATGPRGRDQPALRRAQILVRSGAAPTRSLVITREILHAKLRAQAEVAELMGSTESSAEISKLAVGVERAIDERKVLSLEARAASIYWKLWRKVPVRFAHQNPQRLGPNGRWRPGRTELWLTFGARVSLLTGKPFRATTPGNALLNYLYAILEAEMTVALLATGLDPGIGLFHKDIDNRSSLTLDAIEAIRPHVDQWLFGYLASSAFANRDFSETSDGEVRLTHPLTAQLSHTSALWREACEPAATWLVQSFGRPGKIEPMPMYDREHRARQTKTAEALNQAARFSRPPPHLTLDADLPGRLTRAPQWAPRVAMAPLACWECGKVLVSCPSNTDQDYSYGG